MTNRARVCRDLAMLIVPHREPARETAAFVDMTCRVPWLRPEVLQRDPEN